MIKKIVKFTCIACSSEAELLSGHPEEKVNIDICSNCHPFYRGKLINSTSLGPAEKLKNKFAKGKEYIGKKK